MKNLKIDEIFECNGGTFKITACRVPILPKYFVIERENSSLWLAFIDWLNKTYDATWKDTTYNFYGVDGNEFYNGTNAWIKIEDFKNNPELITLEFWKECIDKIEADKEAEIEPTEIDVTIGLKSITVDWENQMIIKEYFKE